MIVRPEESRDHAAVRAVNLAAFPGPAEADLVEVLRRQAQPLISLVAEVDSAVAGHILFTPVSLENRSEARLMGLAPMAVSPEHQGKGIGSALVKQGLAACRALDAIAVAVLGHPQYYPRFGFVPSTRFGLTSTYEVPEEVFMVAPLQPKLMEGLGGVLHYHPAFAGV